MTPPMAFSWSGHTPSPHSRLTADAQSLESRIRAPMVPTRSWMWNRLISQRFSRISTKDGLRRAATFHHPPLKEEPPCRRGADRTKPGAQRPRGGVNTLVARERLYWGAKQRYHGLSSDNPRRPMRARLAARPGSALVLGAGRVAAAGQGWQGYPSRGLIADIPRQCARAGGPRALTRYSRRLWKRSRGFRGSAFPRVSTRSPGIPAPGRADRVTPTQRLGMKGQPAPSAPRSHAFAR